MTRRLFVTTALPYANAPFHIGHMMEYIQADTWVRFQRMRGHEVRFVCADDAHGAPIMIAAEKAGKTPQAFVTEIAAGRKPYLDGFHIAFDHWHSTDAPENHELAQSIYLALKDQGLIVERTIEQFFDPAKGMFLPDRFIKGECPKCGAKDQYGDNCEVCGAVYAPTELKNPFSALSGATPVMKSSSHFFFQLSSPRCEAFLKEWTQTAERLQPEVLNKISEWFGTDEDGKPKLADWDISRDAPYFAASRARRTSTSTCGWTRPWGIWPRSRPCWARTSTPAWPTRTSSRCTSSARTSSPSTLCSGRPCCTFPAARCRTTSTCTASSPSAARR